MDGCLTLRFWKKISVSFEPSLSRKWKPFHQSSLLWLKVINWLFFLCNGFPKWGGVYLKVTTFERDEFWSTRRSPLWQFTTRGERSIFWSWFLGIGWWELEWRSKTSWKVLQFLWCFWVTPSIHSWWAYNKLFVRLWANWNATKRIVYWTLFEIWQEWETRWNRLQMGFSIYRRRYMTNKQIN